MSSSYQIWQPHLHCSEKIKIFVLESFENLSKILLCWTPPEKNLRIVEERVLLFLDCAHFLQRCKILAPKASVYWPIWNVELIQSKHLLGQLQKVRSFLFFQSVFFISMLGYKLVSIPLQCFFQNLNSEKFERLTYCGSGFGGVCTNLSYQKSKKSKKRKLILDVHKKFEL